MVAQRAARTERGLRLARLHRQQRQVLQVARAQTNATATTPAAVEDRRVVLDGGLVIEAGVQRTLGS